MVMAVRYDTVIAAIGGERVGGGNGDSWNKTRYSRARHGDMEAY